jgi:hypothetical protein
MQDDQVLFITLLGCHACTLRETFREDCFYEIDELRIPV